MKLRPNWLFLIILLAIFLRFYGLGKVPAGIHADEESHGYNAFSLLVSGRDRYGQKLPILFRSFGSYQPPVYTYLSLIPVKLMANSIFAIRFVSALAGVFLVVITYLIVLEIVNKEKRKKLALFWALVVAISPWSIFFSRHVAEGNLGLIFFVLSFLLFLKSLKKTYFFPLACLFLGISTHAYYSERIIALIFLPLFIFLYRKYLLNSRKYWLILGVVLFLLTLIPHLIIAPTGALTKRLDQVGGLSISSFFKGYLTYLSPGNLFFDTGAGLGRMSPEMGVYYSLFLILFFLGLKEIKSLIDSQYQKLLFGLLLISPLAAALTADNFYPLRALEFIWLVGLIIAVGILKLSEIKVLPIIKDFFFAVIFTSLIVSFVLSFFILFKYERAEDYGYIYLPLIGYLKNYQDYPVVIDSARDSGVGLRLAYLTSFDPVNLQQQLKSQMKSAYYSNFVNKDEIIRLNNWEIRPIFWEEDICKKQLLIGDPLAISDSQIKEHSLALEFEVKNMIGDVGLSAYFTNPNKKDCPNL